MLPSGAHVHNSVCLPCGILSPWPRTQEYFQVDFKWFLTGLLMFVSYPVTLLETNIHKSPNAHYLYIMFFWDFSAYFFGGISTRRLHFYLFLINNCRKMKRKNCLVSSLWLPLFPPSRCLRGWDCQHCDHWRHGKLHNLRAEAEFLDSVHYCL